MKAWMRRDRGSSEETIRDYRAPADQFFDWLAETDIPLASVKITDMDDEIAVATSIWETRTLAPSFNSRRRTKLNCSLAHFRKVGRLAPVFLR